MKNVVVWISKATVCIIVSLSLGAHYTFAQTIQTEATCPAGIPETTEADDYTVLSNAEVLHNASGLIFMRCSIGQTWQNGTCEGEPQSFTWQAALNESVTNQFNDNFSWRLPNIKELSIITERACVRPSINDDVFPNTSPDEYWTSTPSMQEQQFAWAVSFTNASNHMRLKDRSLFMRLVRTKLESE